MGNFIQKAKNLLNTQSIFKEIALILKDTLLAKNKNSDECYEIIKYGANLGLDPVVSLININYFQGQLFPSVHMLRGLAISSKLMEYIHTSYNEEKQVATCIIKRKGLEEVTYSFSMEEAKKAEFNRNSLYNRFPRNMLEARVVTTALKDNFADVYMQNSNKLSKEHLEEYLGTLKKVKNFFKDELSFTNILLSCTYDVPPQFIKWINSKPVFGIHIMNKLASDTGELEYMRSNYDEKNDIATCTIKRAGKKEITRSFSFNDAVRSGLTRNSLYARMKKRMLSVRANSFALREAFADIFGSIYSIEEMTDIDTNVESESKVSNFQSTENNQKEATTSTQKVNVTAEKILSTEETKNDISNDVNKEISFLKKLGIEVKIDNYGASNILSFFINKINEELEHFILTNNFKKIFDKENNRFIVSKLI